MTKARRSAAFLPLCIMALLFLAVTGAPVSVRVPACQAPVFSQGQAFAGETDWKTDFDDICSRTQDAMSLSVEELRALVDRCDKLKAKVEAMDGSARKVALKRVQMCRDLYSYVLEQKEKK